jgi:hypothetical protein
MTEGYRPVFREGEYKPVFGWDIRPIKRHEQELKRLMTCHTVQGYDINGMPGNSTVQREERPVEVNITAGGLLLLAVLGLLNCLSNPEGSGIEGGGK